ncbi:MAG: CHAT domain-containing protein [Gemmatimonadetes bacterium]|nr:CHAT domain-containing protein [Gemmatimonadota bacterium]
MLPSHDVVAPTLRRLVAQLERGGAADADARRLGDWLLVPLLPRLARARVERLVFVPEGVLHRLPFDVLQLPDGRPLLAPTRVPSSRRRRCWRSGATRAMAQDASVAHRGWWRWPIPRAARAAGARWSSSRPPPRRRRFPIAGGPRRGPPGATCLSGATVLQGMGRASAGPGTAGRGRCGALCHPRGGR